MGADKNSSWQWPDSSSRSCCNTSSSNLPRSSGSCNTSRSCSEASVMLKKQQQAVPKISTNIYEIVNHHRMKDQTESLTNACADFCSEPFSILRRPCLSCMV